jgi:small-conductance mechanosensitive channel
MFNLRVSLPDVGKAAAVQSDLRTAIFKALRAADIEIPFNQLDVNVRDAEAVQRYLSRLTGESQAGADKQVSGDGTTERNNGNRPTRSGD